MGNRRLNTWRWWLQTLSVGLLVYLSVDSPAFRKWIPRFLIPLAALVLLALLLSIDPRWVFFGSLGVYAGTCLWGVIRREHAEYLAEQERPS